MKRSPRNTGPTTGSSGRHARRTVVVLLTLAAVAGVVWGVKWLGDSARRGIAERDRYTVLFADIECAAPPGIERAPFLSEVRYLSNFPQTFQSIDPELEPKLSAAFAAHPWVAAVEGVSVEPDGAVRVKLKFRAPVLAIRLQGGGIRLLDASGILLSPGADPAGLPELETLVPPPPIRSGLPWPDATVERALQLVEAHRPRSLRKTPQGWRLTMNDGKTVVVEK